MFSIIIPAFNNFPYLKSCIKGIKKNLIYELEIVPHVNEGTTWAPHLIHKDLWNKIGGFSEEFFPGIGSDPDLNMKLCMSGVRIFKVLNKYKVYHFGSIVTRKYKNHPTIQTESGNKGGKIFLLKWHITINFFKKFILNSDIEYTEELKSPKKTLNYFLQLFLFILYYLYIKFIYNINNKLNLNTK